MGLLLAATASMRSYLIAGLLLIQTAFLVDSAARHAPTYLEPAFLVSGIAHWEFGRFEPYRVNPPLVRMIAALPFIAVGYRADWSKFYESPGARSEFHLGDAFVRANGREVVALLSYARWACVPFSLIGAYFGYRWATELYGPNAGVIAIVLYVFEPNLLAHGELITPDAACTAFGILAGYTFWRWLKRPTWIRASIAGASLGLAALSKMSWLILFGLWPILWMLWRILEPRKSACTLPGHEPAMQNDAATTYSEFRLVPSGPNLLPSNCRPPVVQLVAMLLLAVYITNLAYAFDGTGTLLKEFRFVSRSLTGLGEPGQPGNRFQDTLVGLVPLPLPAQYVLGVDSQKRDFETSGFKSYIRGQWSEHGWWYYYLYGLFVKVPCGTWALFAFVLVRRLLQRQRAVPLRDELVLLLPAIALMTLVSSQTGFNTHLRYCFPALGLSLIFISQAGNAIRRSSPFVSLFVCAALVYSVASSLSAYPNHFAYFNDFVGGPRNGHKHLLGSSLDWGQGLGEAIDWIKSHEPGSHVEFDMWSDTLAQILMGQKPENPSRENMGKPCTLILYSADHYWGKDSPLNARPKRATGEEQIVQRFDSGLVLVRVQTR